MNTVRKIVNSNKGLVTLIMILFFVSAGVVRSLSVKLPVYNTKALKESAKQLTAAESEKESSFFAPNPLADGDPDDADLIFSINCYTPNFLVAQSGKMQGTSALSVVVQGYAIPLYDLYCNWKFNLS